MNNGSIPPSHTGTAQDGSRQVPHAKNQRKPQTTERQTEGITDNGHSVKILSAGDIETNTACCICLDLFETPYLTNCSDDAENGHPLCKKCFLSPQFLEKKCPVCRNNFRTVTQAGRIIRSHIKSIQVQCTTCEHQCSFENMDDHMVNNHPGVKPKNKPPKDSELPKPERASAGASPGASAFNPTASRNEGARILNAFLQNRYIPPTAPMPGFSNTFAGTGNTFNLTQNWMTGTNTTRALEKSFDAGRVTAISLETSRGNINIEEEGTPGVIKIKGEASANCRLENNTITARANSDISLVLPWGWQKSVTIKTGHGDIRGRIASPGHLETARGNIVMTVTCSNLRVITNTPPYYCVENPFLNVTSDIPPLTLTTHRGSVNARGW